jgi:hypothetical protein
MLSGNTLMPGGNGQMRGTCFCPPMTHTAACSAAETVVKPGKASEFGARFFFFFLQIIFTYKKQKKNKQIPSNCNNTL